MGHRDLLIDLAQRPRDLARSLRGRIPAQSLNAHPGGHDNSVAWLLWHTGREVDAQLAALTGQDELWSTAGYAERTGLGPVGDGIGYGHSPQQARAVTVGDPGPLLDYLEDCFARLEASLGELDAAELEEVIDPAWDPPVTRSVRLVSIIDDAIQHLAQVSYVLGMKNAGD